MLAPRPTRGGNKKPLWQPVSNEKHKEGIKNNNSSLFEMTYMCKALLKYRKASCE